jgi:hypothetical protein
MAKPGIPNQLENTVFRLIMQNSTVKFPDTENGRPHQFLKLCAGRFTFHFMCMISFPVIIFT